MMTSILLSALPGNGSANGKNDENQRGKYKTTECTEECSGGDLNALSLSFNMIYTVLSWLTSQEDDKRHK